MFFEIVLVGGCGGDGVGLIAGVGWWNLSKSFKVSGGAGAFIKVNEMGGEIWPIMEFTPPSDTIRHRRVVFSCNCYQE